jgi:6 kDa early secretory antigenic target
MYVGELKVDFGALDAVATDIQASAGRLHARLDQLDGELVPLRSGWTGSASDAYQYAQSQWKAAISDMQALLLQLGGAVQASNHDYQAAERTNTARW